MTDWKDSFEPRTSQTESYPPIPDFLIPMLARLIQREGGFVEDPDDPGGTTKYGISQRAYPHLDIAALTTGDAAAIYHQDYYLAPRFNLIPFALVEPVFDMGVNAGTAKALQLAQNILKVKADGVMGPVTQGAFRKAVPGTFHKEYAVERLLHYTFTVIKRPKSVKYIRGWFRRALENL